MSSQNGWNFSRARMLRAAVILTAFLTLAVYLHLANP